MLFLVLIMTCKEAEKMIPAFIDHTLDEDDLEALMQHIENCEMCKEELSIQLLVSEGMDRLESGSSFNLQGSVKRRVDMGKRQINVKMKLKKILFFLEGMIVVGLGVCIWLCFYARG